MEDRILNTKNSVGSEYFSKPIGEKNPISLSTNKNHVYRVTGMDQILDIVECGYVRPKENNRRKDRVFWSIGDENLFYYDKRPVLETPIENVKDGQIGAISLQELSAVWIFNEENNKYENKIGMIRDMYDRVHPIEIEDSMIK